MNFCQVIILKLVSEKKKLFISLKSALKVPLDHYFIRIALSYLHKQIECVNSHSIFCGTGDLLIAVLFFNLI